MNTRFGVFTVALEFMNNKETIQAITSDYIVALEALGGTHWSATQFNSAEPLFLLIATGGTEGATMELYAKRAQVAPDDPVFLIAHPGNNSLPAALEVLARLQQKGIAGRIFYLEGPDDDAGLQQIVQAAHDLNVRKALQQARIGLLGKASDWLVASSPTPEIVKDAWGAEIVSIALNEIVQLYEQAPDDVTPPALQSLIEEATEICEPSTADLNDVGRVYTALRQIVDKYQLDAITLRCFDLVLNQQTTGCFGLSQLTDEGIIAACEGDLVSTIGLLWANWLLDEIPWMANPAQLNRAENSMWLAHCTIPRRMLETYRLRSHFESGLGVAIQGTLPSGSVTLLRIGGTTMRELWLAEGQLIRTGDAENRCRTQAEVQLSRGDVSDLLHAPLGNHVVLVPGHHADRLRMWWQTFIKDGAR